MAIATTPPTAPTARRPRRLGGRMRKLVLLAHIVSAGAWIGIDVVLAVLVFTSILSDDDATKALSYQALELFAVWPLVIAGLSCLVTGVVLSLGSKYGLVRYWWVAVKLVMNIVLSTLTLVALRPGVYAAAEQGERLASGEAVSSATSDLIFPPVVSGTALLIAFTLSVFKPWGRVRKFAGRQ
jgi:hypothetical protein